MRTIEQVEAELAEVRDELLRIEAEMFAAEDTEFELMRELRQLIAVEREAA